MNVNKTVDMVEGLKEQTAKGELANSIPGVGMAIPAQSVEPGADVRTAPSPDKAEIHAGVTVYRRKPLLVSAQPVLKSGMVDTTLGPRQARAGDYRVEEAGRVNVVAAVDFEAFYEVVEDANLIGVGQLEYELGSRIDVDGRRLLRVEVASGKGHIAYWAGAQPSGPAAKFKAVADVVDNHTASHRVGKFLEPYEGKPGGRAWVVLHNNV